MARQAKKILTAPPSIWHNPYSMASASVPELTTTGLAEAVGVPPRTIRQWIGDGYLVPDGWTLGGHARFYAKTAARLVARIKKGRPKAA